MKIKWIMRAGFLTGAYLALRNYRRVDRAEVQGRRDYMDNHGQINDPTATDETIQRGRERAH